MKLSKICAIYTQSYHRILNECFLKTLPVEVLDLFEYENIDDIGAIPGYPGSPNFKNVNYKKMFYIHEKIKENLGNCIIISDLDIVFFRPFKEMVEQGVLISGLINFTSFSRIYRYQFAIKIT